MNTLSLIMHNIIIEDEHGQDLDYSYYKMMGLLVLVQRREDGMARHINSYHAI
jgi:hypothetical protein